MRKDPLLTMKITIVCAFLLLSSLTSGQIWTNAPNGLTVKTVYVPMQKGSASVPIPDFSQIRPLATFNIPNFAVNSDLQLASTLNQQFRPKLNAYELNVPIQDVRAKPNQQQIKAVLQGQIPNFQIVYQSPNIRQQQHNTPQNQNQQLRNHPVVQGQTQLYQPEQISGYLNIHPQNIVIGHPKNNSGIQYQSNDLKNGNMVPQDGYMNVGGGKILQPQHGTNYVHQIQNTPNTIVNPKNVVSNFAYTQYHNIQNPVQSFKPQSNVNQQSVPSHNTIINNAGESTRYFHQMLSNKPVNQQTYISPPSESSSHSTNQQQINYGNPNAHNVQHESSNRHINPFQGFHSQDNSHISQEHTNNQQQHPVNAYAIVHQRVPANHFATQNNQQSTFQQEHGNTGPSSQSSGPSSQPSQGYYVNNESPNYVQTTQEQSSYQGAPQNQINTENQQNSPGNTQYKEQQTLPGSMSTQQYSGHPGTAHTQLIMSQFHKSQQESSESKYIKHQQSSTVPEAQNQDVKSNQQQNAEFYPDPSSETYYPDNKQMAIVPPPDYYPQSNQQQQQPTREQEYVRYSSPSDSSVLNGQMSVSSQNGQVEIPNRNYGYNQDSVHNNNYGQSLQ